MRRFSVSLSLAFVVLLSAFALHAQPAAFAQEGTPAAEEMTSEGVIFELASVGPSVDLASPSTLLVFRVGLDPGAMIPVNDDGGVGILLVDTGTITIEIDGPVSVTRGAGLDEAMATAEATGDMSTAMEAIETGEVVTLDAGTPPTSRAT
jgi:hypothetical protein